MIIDGKRFMQLHFIIRLDVRDKLSCIITTVILIINCLVLFKMRILGVIMSWC